MELYTARSVLPVSGPPLLDGAALAVEGDRIVAVGRPGEVRKAVGEPDEVRDLGDVALVPGLVNAHAHVELSWLADHRPSGGDFVGWLEQLMERRDEEDPETVAEAAEAALAKMLARGTSAIGDIANGVQTVGPLSRTVLQGTVFLELYRFRSAEAEQEMNRAVELIAAMEQTRDQAGGGERIRIVLSPHAAHTTSGPLLKALAGRAAAAGAILSVHIAESEEETSLLMSGTGPLPEFYQKRGVWDDAWKAPGHSPVEYLDRLGVLSPRTLAVHCVHLDRQDLSKLQARGVTAVVCPRSNAYLNVGTAPVPRILSSGVPVALGTDSLASAPDLDLFSEMAALRADHPELFPAAVLRMATLNGARALGLADCLGTLEPNKLAALVAVPLPSPGDDPLEVVTSGPETVVPLGTLSREEEGDRS